MDDGYKPICNNLTDARLLFFKEIGKIIDYFEKFNIKKELVKNVKYSKMPWVEFQLIIIPSIMNTNEISSFIGFGEEFYINFIEGCIVIEKRYYLRGV